MNYFSTLPSLPFPKIRIALRVLISPKKLLGWLGILAFVLVPFTARAEDGIYTRFALDLGYAGRTASWAIYTYGSGTASSRFVALDISSPTSLSQPAQVDGNVATAGDYADFVLRGYGSLKGDYYKKTTGRLLRDSTAIHTGVVYDDSNKPGTSTNLNAGITSLKNVSVTAAGFAATTAMPTTINTRNADGSSTTTNWTFNLGLTGTNITTGTNRVYFVPSTSLGKLTMRLTDFVLTQSSKVTFNGTSGMAAVINVSNNFNMGNLSQVNLTGGLNTSDILFNVTGNNSSTTGALAFEIGGDSQFTGTLLAYNSASKGTQRTFTLSGKNTMYTGEIIANKVVISSGAKVKKPPKVSK